MGGYHLKIKKSDNCRIQMCYLGGECKWRLWASKMSNEASWQIRTMHAPHKCIPFSFEPRKGHMSCEWSTETYRETFRLQPWLRARDLQSILKEKHSYDATLLCVGELRRKL